MAKPTVHHHLNTLVQEEYLTKEDGAYSIGLRFLELGELANVAVMEYKQVVYLYRIRGNEAVNLDTYTGKRVRFRCTALGKAMFSHYPKEEVRAIVAAKGLSAETERR